MHKIHYKFKKLVIFKHIIKNNFDYVDPDKSTSLNNMRDNKAFK